MVDRRDQVLSTFFWRARFSSSTRRSSRSSMYGPFFSERPMSRRLLFRPACDDVAVGWPGSPPCLVALGRLAPWCHRVIALPLALATAHGMVDGVHDRAPHSRAKALPANPPCLADGHVFMVEVADLSNRGHALELDLPDLARRQLDVGVIAFLGQDLCQG